MTAPAVSPWAGLGKRPGAAPVEPPPEDEHDHHPFEHRVIPAAGAPSVLPANPIVSPFTLFRTGGSVGTAIDTTAADTHEEKTMPRTQARAPAKVPHNIQRRVATVLESGGKMTRAEIAKQLPDLDAKQLSQAFFQLSGNSRVRVTDSGDRRTYELTAIGRKWLASPAKAQAAAPAPAKPTAPAKRAKPGRKVRHAPAETAQLAPPATALAVREFQPVIERSFRCGTFNDGGFVLSKNGVQIELTAAEHDQMLRYEERMAEVQV